MMLFVSFISQLIVKAFSKIHQSSLTLKRFFRKPTSPPFIDKAGCTRQYESELSLHSFAQLFPLKGGSTSHLGLLPSGKKRKPLLLVARNHFILWLADHQRSSPAAELRFAVCDRMDTNRLRAACWVLAYNLLDVGCLLMQGVCSLLDAGCLLLAGCLMLAVYSLLLALDA